MNNEDILHLADIHGLDLTGDFEFNEMGVDFRVVFATDSTGMKWVLRIPRRNGLEKQIEHEKHIIDLVIGHLSVSVPDWQIAAPDLVAYPMLEDPPVISFDAEYQVTWNIDKDNAVLAPSLARAIVELQRIPEQQAAAAGVEIKTPDTFRHEVLNNIYAVKREIGMSTELEMRWRKWVDNESLWPDRSAFIHGDLYAGHILANKDGRVSGIIDWSEAHVGDPSIDLAGQLTVFGEQGLRELLRHYEERGGIMWTNIFEHTVERQSTSSLHYAVFALKNGLSDHIDAAKVQLGSV